MKSSAKSSDDFQASRLSLTIPCTNITVPWPLDIILCLTMKTRVCKWFCFSTLNVIIQVVMSKTLQPTFSVGSAFLNHCHHFESLPPLPTRSQPFFLSRIAAPNLSVLTLLFLQHIYSLHNRYRTPLEENLDLFIPLLETFKEFFLLKIKSKDLVMANTWLHD